MTEALVRHAQASGGVGLTVADVLTMYPLRAGSPEVLAGKGSLGRRIRWAHSAELPHVARLLRGGELIFTTGVGLPKIAAGLRRFVVELSDRGVAGLVVELGVAFRSIPRPMIDAAADENLPLIALHREVSFVDVVETINSELRDSEFVQLRRADELQRHFTELLVDGGGIPDVLAAVAAAIENPVVLQREDGELLHHAVYARGSAEVLSAWDHARHCLPGAVECRAVPVATGRERAGGHLVAMAVDGEFSTLTSAALERASGLIALATQLSRHEEILAARARGNLLVSLLEGDLSETEIARQVEAVGFPPGVPHLLPCVLSPLDAHQSAHGCDDTVWTLVWRDVRRELVGQKVPVIGGLVPGTRQIALVVGLAGADQRQPRADSLARLFHAALQRQFGVTGAAALYVGASSRSWTGITSSLAEVLEAAEFPRGGSPWHDATAPDLDRLLWRLRDSGDLQTFVRRRLGPLIEHDRRRTMKLLPTLEAYLTFRGHKAETARALHIERQSVYYRIAQIETLLGASLDDEEVRLGVHLALRASRVAGATATATDHEGPIETRSHLKIGRSRVAALPPVWTAANHQTARRQASETSHL